MFNDNNFDLSDKKRENRSRKEDCQLQALLDEDDTQSQKMLAEQLDVSQAAISMRLHAMGKVPKIGKWVPHELNDRQIERRQNTCQILLARQKRKSFLHRIVTDDEKWIYFQNPKRKKSWIDPAQSSISSSRPNRFGRKPMLCVWWDQEGVTYYELLKPSETVNAHGYQQLIKLHRALREKRHYWKRHDKLIFLHDNAPSHMSTMVQNYLETLNWEVLSHPAYSPDLASSDYHLFSSMGHTLAERHFDSYEDVRK